MYCFSIAIFKLQFVEFVIISLVFEQLLVRTFFDDSAVLKHDDLVCMLYCGQSVRHNKHRADIADVFKGFLYDDFRFCVYICRRLIQNENLRFVQHRSCKRQKLTLTLREVLSSFDNLFVKSVFLRRNERIGVDVLARRLDFLVGERLVVEGYIAPHRTAEKEHVLKHLSYALAKRMNIYCAYISAVDKNLTFLNLVVTHDERKYGRLSRTRRAHKSARFLRIYGERHVFENPILALVGKPYVLKLDFAIELVHRHRVFPISDFGLDVKQVEQPLGRGYRLLQVVELIGKVLYGVEKARQIEIERNYHARVQSKFHSEPERHGNRADIKQRDKRTIYAESKHHFVSGFAQIFVLFQKFKLFLLLTIENLDKFHAGQVFVEKSVEVGYILSFLCKHLFDHVSEHEGRDEHNNDERKHHKRKLPRDVQHNAVHAHHRKHVLDDVHDDVGKQVGHRRRVGRNARNERAYGHFVKLILRQLLDVRKHIVAQRVDYILSRLLQEHGLPNEKCLVEHAYGKIRHRHADDKLHVYAVRLQVVGDLTDEKRQDYIQNDV